MDWNASKAACHQAVIEGRVEAVQPWVEEVDMAYLEHHWGDAYDIRKLRPDEWTARRRDSLTAVLRDGDPEGLLEQIRRDYQSRPVPRH